jgi:polyisoprenoid-binding protein YceI
MDMLKQILTLALATLPLSAIAASDTYPIDPIHSSVNFTVDHLGLSLIHGHFTKFAGKFNIDRAAKAGSVEWSVDTASVDTGDPDKGSRARSRDDHLRSADFFNPAEFPKMTFKSTNVVFNGDTPTKVEGSLTLLGVTKPVSFVIERFKCNPPTAAAKERCGGHVVGTIKRSEFGMKYGIPNVGDDIALAIGFEGNKDS